jgi:hypothetical protein
MDPIEEFHRHADECRRMARVAKDRQSRDTWNSMAEKAVNDWPALRKRRTGPGLTRLSQLEGLRVLKAP